MIRFELIDQRVRLRINPQAAQAAGLKLSSKLLRAAAPRAGGGLAMALRNLPIRRKLMIMLLLTSGAVLAITCAAFIAYQYESYRAAARCTVQTLGQVMASNSTAALAFDNPSDEKDVLAALHAERRVSAGRGV